MALKYQANYQQVLSLTLHFEQMGSSSLIHVEGTIEYQILDVSEVHV